MAVPKRKQTADTETLRAEAQSALQAIDAEIAELDKGRLELDPQAVVAKELYATADEQHKIAALLLGAGYRLVDIITNSTWRPPSRKADVLAVPVEPH
jgi:hypothetical protein